MGKVAIEVRNGTARLMVGVEASNIKQALRIVQTRGPARGAAVKFPIDPGGSFLLGGRAA